MSFVLSLIAAIAFTMGLAGPPAAYAEASLADAYAIILSKKRVDLAHAFGADTPVWRGFGRKPMA